MSSPASSPRWSRPAAGCPCGGYCSSAPSAPKCSTPWACSTLPPDRRRFAVSAEMHIAIRDGSHEVPAAPAEPPQDAAPQVDADGWSVLELVDLLLRDPARLDRLNRDPARQRVLLPRFLLLAQAGYLVYSAVMLLLLNLAPPEAAPAQLGLAVPRAAWHDGSALGLPVTYATGVVLATCICLPSFYFYSLLAGVHITWAQITCVIIKGTAANAVMLLGILPIYVAVALGLLVFKGPPPALAVVLLAGLFLPFAAGLWGLWEIYRGIMDLAAALPPAWQCGRRCFLRRLTLSWAAVYTAVAPVMIYRLWEYVAGMVPAP